MLGAVLFAISETRQARPIRSIVIYAPGVESRQSRPDFDTGPCGVGGRGIAELLCLCEFEETELSFL